MDGQLEEAPGARVRPDQVVTVAPDASLLELTPVTLLLHKPGWASKQAWACRRRCRAWQPQPGRSAGHHAAERSIAPA